MADNTEKKELEGMPFIGLMEEIYEKRTDIKLKQNEIKALKAEEKASIDAFLEEYDTTPEAINISYKQYEKFNDSDVGLEDSNQVELALTIMNAALSQQ